MGWQIIKQPNAKFAIFSSIVDAFILLDANEEEIIAEFIAAETKRLREAVQKKLDLVKSGRADEAYHQFKITWAEALESHRENAETEKEIDELIETITATPQSPSNTPRPPGSSA